MAPHEKSFEVGRGPLELSTRRRTWVQVTAGPVAPGSVCVAQNLGDIASAKIHRTPPHSDNHRSGGLGRKFARLGGLSAGELGSGTTS